MSKTNPSMWNPPWEQPEWLSSATAWIHSQLEELGMQTSGPIQQPHIRPWSTVLQVPTSDGDIFFKAGAPFQAFEPALLQALTRFNPGVSVPVLAADTQKGWMLMPDGGKTLRQRYQEEADLKRWEKILPLYAELQIETAAHANELLDLGCPDRRLPKLGSLYRSLLADKEAMLIGHEDGLSNEDYAHFQELETQFNNKVEQLAAFNLPATLDHGDLHDANVLFDGSDYTFFDWGDASLTHPFFSLIIVLRVIASKLEIDVYDPQLTWVRDAYLEAWIDFAPLQELIAAFDLAHHVGKLARAYYWYNVIMSIAPASVAKFIDYPPGWVWEFLHHKTS